MKGRNKMNIIETKTYKVSEIMQMLGISKATAYNFIKNNPPFEVVRIGDTFRVLKESFDTWINNSCSE